ncbi:MAG: hypothetical protein JSW33_12370 [bacterium]|nr:MAG: hypothetical protein JSW33_12370 [bacterium]
MGHIHSAKKVIEKMNHNEILSLLDYLRRNTDIIIPKCYSRAELLKFLRSEGINAKLSEEAYQKLKKEVDNGCKELMNEVLRTQILLTLDAASDVSEAVA